MCRFCALNEEYKSICCWNEHIWCRESCYMDQVQSSLPLGLHLRVAGEEADLPYLWERDVLWGATRLIMQMVSFALNTVFRYKRQRLAKSTSPIALVNGESREDCTESQNGKGLWEITHLFLWHTVTHISLPSQIWVAEVRWDAHTFLI